MSKRDLLIEIGLEEMPARFVDASIQQLAEKLKGWLDHKKISFNEVRVYSTPRRLAVIVTSVSEKQEDLHEEAKGPAKKVALSDDGEWTKAAIGFCRGQDVSVDDIFFKEVNGIEYVHVKKFTKGQDTIALLPEMKGIITGLTFPKNMRWAGEELKYIRPIKWLVALFGTEVVPFSITTVETGKSSKGHRFLGEEVILNSANEYEEAMLGQFVIVDAEKRKQAILSQLEKIEEENNWDIPVDQALLSEVTNLVEYPTALHGRFEDEYLAIPEEVLITSMKEHQRYFPVKSKDGSLLPYFVTVRNGDHNHLETVARGNEKVLRARLADAAFFYKEDQKLEISSAINKLKTIVYHEDLGTLYEKVERVRSLTNKISDLLNFDDTDKDAADRAAEICKFDLVSQMVYEFPELQGIMGEKYARQKGEKEEVAVAINEHYMPRNAEDNSPNSNPGAAVALAEKLDTIVSFFAIGLIPSGSQDPYALRRQASGIVQTLLYKKWRLNIDELIKDSLQNVLDKGIGKREKDEVYLELIQFFKLRLKHLLQERGIRYDLIDAILGEKLGEVPSLLKKAEILQARKEEEGFKDTIEALSRVLNISSKANDVEDVKPELFENEYETNLYNHFSAMKQEMQLNINENEYYEKLVSLKTPISEYFDHTMVMAEDERIKANRLNQMWALAQIILKFAKVNLIITK